VIAPLPSGVEGKTVNNKIDGNGDSYPEIREGKSLVAKYVKQSTQHKSQVFDHLLPQDLEGQSLFEGVDHDKLIGLLEDCPIRQVKQGDVVITKDDAHKECYLILSGALRVHLDAPDSSAISVIHAGESVGEISLLDGKPASAFVVADEESRLLVLPEDIFWSLVNVSHDFAQRLLYLLATRMRDSNAALSDSIRHQQEYKRNATLDELTGLHNRRWMHEMVERQIKRCRFNGEPLSLLIIDIDHFKSVNDNYGHLTGDQVLRNVAWTLMNNLRPTDMLARYGGEEFVAVLPNSDLAGARVAAETMRTAVRHATNKAGEAGALPATTVSIGIAQLQPGQSFEELVESADQALYLAKNNGRNRVEGGLG
jgi:diguanylate cyclase (GGDEF)-like protein